MPYCGPSNAVPSCAAVPTVGFGSNHSGFGSGFGYGGYGIGSGGTTSAASLGVLPGVHPRGIVQVSHEEVIIQPPPAVVTIPGPILSATPVLLRIGGYAPCAVSGSGSGFGSGFAGLGSGYVNTGLGFSCLNSRILGPRGSLGLNPFYDVCN